MQKVIHARVHDYYWQDDFSCAVTTLKILAELFYPELHPQVIAAASGLNAGRFGLQCGLVEGALLFIGSYGCRQNIGQEQIKQLCQEYCREFEARFGSMLCRELRPQGFSPDNPPHLCEGITKEAVCFSAEFIAEKVKK